MKLIIWSLEVVDWEDYTLYQQIFFLTKYAAERYLKKHHEEFKDYKIIIGGVPFHLW